MPGQTLVDAMKSSDSAVNFLIQLLQKFLAISSVEEYIAWAEVSSSKGTRQLQLTLELPGLSTSISDDCNVAGLNAKQARRAAQRKRNEMTIELINDHMHFFSPAWDAVKDIAGDHVKALMHDFLTYKISEEEIFNQLLVLNKALKAFGIRLEALITEDCISICQVSVEDVMPNGDFVK
ncbi:unnamed protein product, partial [Symbiodinium microadriaticum]